MFRQCFVYACFFVSLTSLPATADKRTNGPPEKAWFSPMDLYKARKFWAFRIGTEPTTTIEKSATQRDVTKDVTMIASVPAVSVAGATIPLRIKVMNQSRREIRSLSRTKYWDYDLKILDAEGRPVPYTRFGKIAYGDVRGLGSSCSDSLPAGSEIEATLNLARLFDLTREGQYTLFISRQLNHLGEANEGIELTIEKITFQVVEDPYR